MFRSKILMKLVQFCLFICGISALDLEESITINKPVMRSSDIPTWTQFSTGSVRCFCNLPACVSTGYMCKSSSGGCFSDLLHHSPPQTVYRGRHGCVELLTDKEQRNWCQRNPNSQNYPLKRKNVHQKSLLHCCYQDMCNHADDPLTRDLLNNTMNEHITNDNENRVVESHLENGYNSSDVWFKAATIAVPICGAVILFVLIFLAVRLLRTESLNNSTHKLGAVYPPSNGNINCSKLHDHYHTSQSLLRKEGMIPHQNPIYANHIADLQRPIIINKDINLKSNCKYNDNNLLSNNPHMFEIHKCYDNKNNLITNDAGDIYKYVNILKNSSPEISYSNSNDRVSIKDVNVHGNIV